jgi:hypothetical protein
VKAICHPRLGSVTFLVEATRAGIIVVAHQVGLLDELERLEHWLLHRGRAELTPSERHWLTPSFTRLLRDAVVVAELVEDLLKEMQTP